MTAMSISRHFPTAQYPGEITLNTFYLINYQLLGENGQEGYMTIKCW
jgi:hypothetical protein